MRPIFQRFAHWIKSFSASAAAWARGDDSGLGGARATMTAPFAQSVWVHASINKVAGPIAAVDLCWYDNDEEIEDDGLDAFWSAPAIHPDGTRMSGADFRHISTCWLLLRGEVFYLLDDSWVSPFPEVAGITRTPLIILRPDRMRHVIQNGELMEWVLTDAAGKQIHLPKDRVIHVKQFNPYDDWRGLGNMEAAWIAAGGDYAAGVFAKNTAEANGDQGVYVVAKSGIPTDEQREQITAQLREKRAAQQRGIFRPAFLTGDITIEDPKLRAVDVAFISQRVEARKEIAIAFGVPPSFFDPVGSYSIGAASDRYILIEETCKPIGTKLGGSWSLIGSRMLGRNVEAELDWDDHSVMQAVRRERLDSAIKLWGTGMPMESVSDYLSLDLPEFPGWDIGYLPFSVAPINAVGETMPDPTTDPALAETDPNAPLPDPVQEMKRALSGSTARAASSPAQRAGKVQLWESHMRLRRSTVRAFETKITRALMMARAEILSKLEKSGLAKGSAARAASDDIQGSAVRAASDDIQGSAARAASGDSSQRDESHLEHRNVAVDMLFDFHKWNAGVTAALRNVSAATLQTSGSQLLGEIGRKDDPWKMPMPEAVKFLDERENLISQADAAMWDKIKTSLNEGLDAGDSLKELANRVRAEFNSLSDYEAKRIALTETNTAFGAGRQQAMTDAGVQFKSWVSSHGPNVRPAHHAAEIQYSSNPIPVDQPFIVGGEALMFPGDPAGSPGNIINCQCVQIAVAPPGEESA